MSTAKNTEDLSLRIQELESQLFEANTMLEAIKEGSVDALVLRKEGAPVIYSLETADYTYRILIEKIGEGAVSISDTGLILYCNEYFARLTGLPAAQLIGTYFICYVDTIGQFQELKKRLSEGTSKGEIVLNINGRKIPVYASLTNLEPQVSAIGIVISDLTEQRKHEEEIEIYQQKLETKIKELHNINSNLEQFIHIVSHDIKEPVRKIVSYSSHIVQEKKTGVDKNVIKELTVVNDSALRLRDLVDDLVDYSVNARKLEPVITDLNEILGEVITDLELTIEENSAQVKYLNLPKVKGSPVQLRQLFLNLLSNAMKFKKPHEKPKISITSETQNCVDPSFPNKNFYKISVKDNGIGIESKNLSRIFTLFNRIHAQNVYEGNGIGLSICKRIMENHFGKIEVTSKVNSGSTFHLYFPAYY